MMLLWLQVRMVGLLLGQCHAEDLLTRWLLTPPPHS
jgi:hypothetical protein